MRSPRAARAPRSLPHIRGRCTPEAASPGLGLGDGQDATDPCLQTGRELPLGALRLDQRPEMDAELEPVRACPAAGQVPFDLHPDDVVHLAIQEALQFSERLLTLGPAVIHRQVLAPWPFPTTRAPALSFPDGGDS